MFTPNGTFEQVVGWLLGFAYAEEKHDSLYFSEWSEFEQWIQWRLHFPMNEHWYPYVRKVSSDDEPALQYLLDLFSEFYSWKLDFERKASTRGNG